jgi:hypothetical protein
MLSPKAAQNVRSRLEKVKARLKTSQNRYGCVFVRIKKVDNLINFELEVGFCQPACIIQSSVQDSKDTLQFIKSELWKEFIKMTVDEREWNKASCSA